MNTQELFAELNAARVANGKKPLKAWKESRAKLEAAFDHETAPLGTPTTPADAPAETPAFAETPADISPAGIDQLADFLVGWSKGKPIEHASGSFYNCGKWSTKIAAEQVAVLIAEGHARGTLARFVMKKKAEAPKEEAPRTSTPAGVARIAKDHGVSAKMLRQKLRRLEALGKLPFKRTDGWSLDAAAEKFVVGVAKEMKA